MDETTHDPMNFAGFRIPLAYRSDKCTIKSEVSKDLELKSGPHPLYESLLNADDDFKKLIIPQLSRWYTTDTIFLKDTQHILKGPLPAQPSYHKIMNIYKTIEPKHDTFLEQYHYIEWKPFQSLNTNQSVMQCMSVYNICSPILSLALPIFMLIIPLFMIRLHGIQLSFHSYIQHLLVVLKHHSIGQIFFIHQATLDKQIFILLSFIFYFIQVYFNVQSCVKFIKNMTHIHDYIFTVQDYLTATLSSIDSIQSWNVYPSYKPFLEHCNTKRVLMHTICKELQQVTPFQYTGSKLLQLGKIMRIYYLCNTDRAWKETIQYSIYFNSYIHSLSCIKDKLHKSLHFCKYSKKKTYFKGIYYPHIEKELVVHNDVCLSTNIIITGPNAAGKTTLLKTIMLNTILCQQFGCGYFNKARLQPYHVLSSYINIPDTSERESLFQAEAVRCKTILDDILCNKERRHLCIFDELFSGTNPYEATSAAKAYLKYIHKQNNVRFLLTTHFVDMCKQLKDECDICNMHMQVEKDMHHSFIYTYRILKGISSVKGGVKVLNDLNYPQEIIKDCLCEINRHN